jgi:hypothetical protein
MSLFFHMFAFSDVADYTYIPAVARVIFSGVGNHVDVPDDTVWQEDSMLDIQVHAVLRGTIPELLQARPVFGVNSVEYQIDRQIRFSGEAQDFVGFVRPNEFTIADFPCESSRVTQPLSLCKVLPSSLQLGLRRLQILVSLRKCNPSI